MRTRKTANDMEHIVGAVPGLNITPQGVSVDGRPMDVARVAVKMEFTMQDGTVQVFESANLSSFLFSTILHGGTSVRGDEINASVMYKLGSIDDLHDLTVEVLQGAQDAGLLHSAMRCFMTDAHGTRAGGANIVDDTSEHGVTDVAPNLSLN